MQREMSFLKQKLVKCCKKGKTACNMSAVHVQNVEIDLL